MENSSEKLLESSFEILSRRIFYDFDLQLILF